MHLVIRAPHTEREQLLHEYTAHRTHYDVQLLFSSSFTHTMHGIKRLDIFELNTIVIKHLLLHTIFSHWTAFSDSLNIQLPRKTNKLIFVRDFFSRFWNWVENIQRLCTLVTRNENVPLRWFIFQWHVELCNVQSHFGVKWSRKFRKSLKT